MYQIRFSSPPFTYTTGSQTVGGRAEGSEARGGKKGRRGGRTKTRGAETSGGVTEDGGGDEECSKTEAGSGESHEPVEPRAGGAAHQAPSGRWQSVHHLSIQLSSYISYLYKPLTHQQCINEDVLLTCLIPYF